MEAMQAVRVAARDAGIALAEIGPAMGRSVSYVSVKINQGRDPGARILAKMLGICGYALCAVPDADVPDSALCIG